MQKNRISAELTDENETLVLQYVNDAAVALDFLVELTTDERKRLAKMGRKDLDFVERSLRHANGSPQYLPPYLQLDELQKDMLLAAKLKNVYKQVNELGAKLKDTIRVAESEALEVSRAYYKSVREAANNGAESAELIYKDLAIHYKNRGPKPSKIDDDESNEVVNDTNNQPEVKN